MSFQFQGQRPDETVLLVVRQHPVVLLAATVRSVLAALVPVALLSFGVNGPVVQFAIAVSLLAVIIVMSRAFYSWYATLFLLTNDRVIWLEQRGFFHKELTEFSLASIIRVTHRVSGVIGTMFGYGEIDLDTASTHQPAKINSLPDPYGVQVEVMEARDGIGMVEVD